MKSVVDAGAVDIADEWAVVVWGAVVGGAGMAELGLPAERLEHNSVGQQFGAATTGAVVDEMLTLGNPVEEDVVETVVVGVAESFEQLPVAEEVAHDSSEAGAPEEHAELQNCLGPLSLPLWQLAALVAVDAEFVVAIVVADVVLVAVLVVHSPDAVAFQAGMAFEHH